MVYHQPEQLAEALHLLGQVPGIQVAAGCTDLFPATAGPALGGPVLDITRVQGLRGISQRPFGWRIGGATTWADILAASHLPPAFDMLKQAAREVGSVQIQSTGTIAGNLCNASPAADGVPPLLALDAQVELSSEHGTRNLPLAQFLTGPRQTARAQDEILTAIDLPKAAVRGHSGFAKLGARRYLVISIAMVALRLDLRDGRVRDLAIAVGACSPVARRMTAAENALRGAPVAELEAALPAGCISDALAPIDDIRATGPYRGEAAEALTRRLLAREATGGAT